MENQINKSWPGWETVRMIGQGGFGAVYEIHRKLFEDDKEIEKAALKVLTLPKNESDIEELRSEGYDEESITNTYKGHLKSIVAEYSLMRKMNGSANIVNCDDVRYIQHSDSIGWDIYIKMELLTPLSKTLPAQIPEETVIRIGLDMCMALELCKKYNIIHRDIKPQNIFLSDNGDYKLGDFGIAKTVEKTTGGTMTGTYKYMAPEVYSNKPYNHSVDIYSLGLVLYWLLNDRRMPFMPLPPAAITPSSGEESMRRRFSGEAIPAPRYGSPQLQKIVLKACSFSPQDRYQSPSEMRAALAQLADRTGEYAYDDGASDQTVLKSRDNGDTVINRSGNKVRSADADGNETDDETVSGDNRTVNGDRTVHSDNAGKGRKHKALLRFAAVAVCVLLVVCAALFMKRDPAEGSSAPPPSGNNTEGTYEEENPGALPVVIPVPETQPEDASGENRQDDNTGIPEERDITLKIWAGQEDCEDMYCWIPEMLEQFEQAHPEYTITWVTETEYDGTDTYRVVSDLENAADVYLYQGGVLDALVQCNALTPLPADAVEYIGNNYGEFYNRVVTHKDGNMYGFPLKPISWCLYYDKSVFTEEDVKSLDTMLEKAGVVFPMHDIAFSSTFFLSNGALFFGESGYSSAAGIRFDTEQAPEEAVQKMVELMNHPNFVVDEGYNHVYFSEGTAAAMICTDWVYDLLYMVLGENLGCAPLPAITIAGEEKPMRVFADAQCIGVNPYTDHPKAAMELAAFLASAESQMLRYEIHGAVPALPELCEEAEIQNSPLTVAMMRTIEQSASFWPNIEGMRAYYNGMDALRSGLLDGSIHEGNYKERLSELFTFKLKK